MRRAMILGIVVMFGGATQSLHADDADTLDSRIEREQKTNRAAAKGLDIDYQLCAAVVIADAIKDLASTDTVYLSFIGEDPSKAALETLRPLLVSVLAGSLEPLRQTPSRHTSQWRYDVWSILPGAATEYTAVVTYYCGSLCAGTIEYHAVKAGKRCAVQSSKLLQAS